MNLATIRDNLKTRLATVTGLRAYDTVPDQIAVPAAVVMPGETYVEYQTAMGMATAEVRFDIMLVVARTSERAAQNSLDAYLSSGTAISGSVIDALEGDRRLAGAVEDFHVESVGPPGPLDVGQVTYLSTTVHVMCIADRS